MRNDLIEKVLTDLKGVIPYKENIVWEDFTSIRTLGKYCIKENKIKINEYLEDDQEILDVMAHELIHSCGVRYHRQEFREYAKKINSLGLGYNVDTHYHTDKDNKFKQMQKQVRENRKPSKEYIVWCSVCGWHRVYQRKNHKLSNYRCPKCYGSLRQKQFKKDGVSISWGKR